VNDDLVDDPARRPPPSLTAKVERPAVSFLPPRATFFGLMVGPIDDPLAGEALLVGLDHVTRVAGGPGLRLREGADRLRTANFSGNFSQNC
jgi:hypothetical protein